MRTWFTHNPDPNDQTMAQLRTDAQAFDPDPPAGVRSRLAEDLARLEPAPAPRHWKGALATAGGLLAVIVVALIVFREKPAPAPVAIPNKDTRPTTPNTSLAAAHPLALTERFLESPMQSELNNLVLDLNRTTKTISTILPSPKKAKAATKATGV